MLRDRAIRYVPPSQCSSREAEIGSTRRDDQLLRLENSVLKVHSKPQAVRVDLSTDLRLYQAVCRRGLALEVSGICGYDTHEKCMRVLFDHLHRHPPAGYTAPAMEQFLRSDREIWRLVAEKVTHEFAQSGGSKLVDQALQDFCQDASVTFHLLPLPKPPPSLKRPWDQAFNGASRGNRQDKGGKKGKGRGKGKQDKGIGAGKGNNNVPGELKGLSGMRNGVRLCFNFNLAHGCTLECTDINGNATCSRGAHLCMRCGGKHSAASCES